MMAFSLKFLFIFVLLEVREKETDRPSGSVPECLHLPGLGQADSASRELSPGLQVVAETQLLQQSPNSDLFIYFKEIFLIAKSDI